MKVLAPKVAIVYDRVNKWGGAERVLLALHKMFPEAPLYTSVYDSKKATWASKFPKVYTSFLQKVPFFKSHHEFLAVLMPIAFEEFNFSKYDLVISVTSEFAKNIVTNTNTYHLCYCLTPTRYLWSDYKRYFRNSILKWVSKPFVKYLKFVDIISSKRPDKIISISKLVRERVKEYYKVDSEVIYPPLTDLGNKEPTKNNRSYYLYVGRLVGYKKVDLLIDTFNKSKNKLVIVGSGFQKPFLKWKANNNIKFVENITDKDLSSYYKNAKALIMPQSEDFGIVAIEAQSYGTPVISYTESGASETIIKDKTGLLFDKQTVESLSTTIAKFEKMSFNHKYIAKNVEKYSFKIFEKRLQESLIRIDSGRGRRNSSLAKVT